jgi:hypothetical protein
MRVLAIAEVLHLLELQRQDVRETCLLIGRDLAVEPRGDRAVVSGRVKEDRAAELEARPCGYLAGLLDLRQHPAVVARGTHDGDVRIILGCGAQHGRSADVDVLDRILERAPRFRNRLLEGVEVHDHQVDGLDAVLLHLPHVLGVVPPAQDPAVHLGVQGLDPPVEHLREAGELRDVLDRDARVAEQFGRAAR